MAKHKEHPKPKAPKLKPKFTMQGINLGQGMKTREQAIDEIKRGADSAGFIRLSSGGK